MFYIVYGQEEEMICEDFDLVIERILSGWKLYGYTDNQRLAESLLHECKHY
nr:hypothetical protein [uncultured Bacillus sp.]